jgi:hypothetical protein
MKIQEATFSSTNMNRYGSMFTASSLLSGVEQGWKGQFLCPKPLQLSFNIGFAKQIRSDFGRVHPQQFPIMGSGASCSSKGKPA